MASELIDSVHIVGVRTKILQVLADERGRLMEILRRDDPLFLGFGQVYLTTAYPNVVKAWHRHQLQTDHFCAVRGMIKLVLFDGREDSPSHGQLEVFTLGDWSPRLVQIPPGVFHGFKNIGLDEALVINCVTEPYDHAHPDEQRLPAHGGPIPYDWSRVDR